MRCYLLLFNYMLCTDWNRYIGHIPRVAVKFARSMPGMGPYNDRHHRLRWEP